MELNNLNAMQLKQIITKASSALNRRRKVEKAMVEIQRVAKKYKLSKDELKMALVSLQTFKAVSTSKAKAVRAKVEPKYQSQDGSSKWTGRGRAPSWVTEICRSKGMTVEGFKSDSRFLIQSTTPNSSSTDRE